MTIDKYDELPDGIQDAVPRPSGDEDFVVGVGLSSGLTGSSALILTDERLIEAESGMMSEETDSVRLESLSTVDYSGGIRKGKVKIDGWHGEEKEYKLSKGTAKDLRDELRRFV